MWQQYCFKLAARSRGFHIVTEEILHHLSALRTIDTGLLHLFIRHTSASLTINENADPTVRCDLESYINKTVPERAPYYLHTYEGDDDMPAHIKASLLGNNLTIPIANGELMLGTWQGIYLGEHRDSGGAREIVATITGSTI